MLPTFSPPGNGEEQEPRDQSPWPCSPSAPRRLHPGQEAALSQTSTAAPLQAGDGAARPGGMGTPHTHTCCTCSRRAAGWPGSPRSRSVAGSSAQVLYCSPAPPGRGRMGGGGGHRQGTQGSERAHGSHLQESPGPTPSRSGLEGRGGASGVGRLPTGHLRHGAMTTALWLHLQHPPGAG